MEYQFARSINNYGISDKSAIYLIENNKSFEVGLSREGNKKIAWVGFDKFGNRLECVAIVFIDSYYIMHLKPIDPALPGLTQNNHI